jgi:hypothetical protein
MQCKALQPEAYLQSLIRGMTKRGQIDLYMQNLSQRFLISRSKNLKHSIAK